MKHLLTFTALVAITACTERSVSIDCPPNVTGYDAVRYDCGSYAEAPRPEQKETKDVDRNTDDSADDSADDTPADSYDDGIGDNGGAAGGGNTPPQAGNPGNDKPVGNAGEQPGGKDKGDGVKGASQ